MPREKSAGAVVFRKEGSEIYYLLLYYKSGHWDFPKGHIERGEKEEETVKREVAEETGIDDIKIIKGFREQVRYFFRKSYGLKGEEKKKAATIFKIVVFYLAQTKIQEVNISLEHLGFKWLSYEESLRQLTFKNARNILEKANSFILNYER